MSNKLINKPSGFKQLWELMNNLPSDMSIETYQSMSGWQHIRKSPYGHSYYDRPKGWDFTINGTHRLSDHWNFVAKEKSHCITSVPVPNNTHWTIAKYDKTTETWIPYLSVEKKIQTDEEFEEIKSFVYDHRKKVLVTIKAKELGLIDEKLTNIHTKLKNTIKGITNTSGKDDCEKRVTIDLVNKKFNGIINTLEKRRRNIENSY